MDEQERNNILRILNETIKAIKNSDISALKNLSNQTIHDASVLQESHAISIAVLIYTLSKIYEREASYSEESGWKDLCKTCDIGIEIAKNKLETRDYIGFDNALRQYIKNLSKLDRKLRNYIQDVLHRARISKASRIYEHGISIGRTAELLGITRFELMDYVGRTGIADVSYSITFSAKHRLNIARSLFK